MPFETLLNLALLAAAASLTPGPNNMLVAASGAHFGLRRTLPHVLGIALGYAAMIFIVGLFLGKLFESSLILRESLRWGGAALLLWIAWKIASAGALSSARGEPRPFTFVEAAGFQWINPKGWAMAVALVAQFIHPEAPVITAAILAATFIAAGVASATTWALAGQALTRWLTSDARRKAFNATMGALIAGCVLLLFA